MPRLAALPVHRESALGMRTERTLEWWNRVSGRWRRRESDVFRTKLVKSENGTPVQCSRVLILLQLPKNVQPRLLLDAVLCIIEVSGGTATFLPIHFSSCALNTVTSCCFGSGWGLVLTQIMLMEIPFHLTCFIYKFSLGLSVTGFSSSFIFLK